MEKLYITDLDGTLLNSHAQLSVKTERVLKTLLDEGLHFTIATLRSIESIKPIFHNVPLQLPIIELSPE